MLCLFLFFSPMPFFCLIYSLVVSLKFTYFDFYLQNFWIFLHLHSYVYWLQGCKLLSHQTETKNVTTVTKLYLIHSFKILLRKDFIHSMLLETENIDNLLYMCMQKIDFEIEEEKVNHERAPNLTLEAGK